MTTRTSGPPRMTLIHVWAFIGAAHSDRSMHAVIGRVKIKPDRAGEALALLTDSDTAMLPGMAGSASGSLGAKPRG